MAMFELQARKGLEPTDTWQRPLPAQKSAVAATAQTFYFDIPKDHFIHEILVQIVEDGAYEDDILSLQVVGNGNKYLKDMLGGMCVNVQRLEGQRHIAGFYHLFFSTPHIPEAKPLPAWVFTSLQLIIIDNAPASTKYHTITVTVVESKYKGEDLSDWKILVEKYLRWAKYGANTGWQEYEHERAYKIFSYLYVEDDNTTIADDKFDKLKLLGRAPDGELTIVGEVPIRTLQAENKGRCLQDIDAGYFFLEWALGFPTTKFTSLKSYLNIPTGGTNISVRVLERYVL